MVRAIVENCLPRVSQGAPLPTAGLEPRGSGAGWRTADGAVTVLDTGADFACQVIAAADPGPVSESLSAWAGAAGFAVVGRTPLGRANEQGMFLFGRAQQAPGYVQIHLTNLPGGHVGALLTRTETNREAERALRQ